ncbi:putative membrane protein [Streptococcus pneumoniae 2070335]|nr:putative membrane protein [Streptococcus pneumoniae 2070335]
MNLSFLFLARFFFIISLISFFVKILTHPAHAVLLPKTVQKAN